MFTNDEIIKDLVSGIYSYLPENTSYPFIRFTNTSYSDCSFYYYKQAKYEFEIEVLSDKESNRECLVIVDEIQRVCEQNALSEIQALKISACEVFSVPKNRIWCASLKLEGLGIIAQILH